MNSVLDLVGNTPTVGLRHLPGASAAAVLCKCEQFNPSGSSMDRIALALIDAAERAAEIRPGESVIVEASSGNTGVALALICAAKGYRLIVTMPASMSLERRQLIKAYGAELMLTPAEQSMAGAIERANELCRSNTNYFFLRQFENPANPDAHRRSTAQELLTQIDRPIDALVLGVGTGGTLSGVGEILRQNFSSLRIVAVEPKNSAVLSGGSSGPHKIQGLGVGFVPSVLNRSLIDEVRLVSDRDAYDTKILLAKKEGLLVGMSSGANVFVACNLARQLGPDKCVVTMLCDTGERYFSLDEYLQPFKGYA